MLDYTRRGAVDDPTGLGTASGRLNSSIRSRGRNNWLDRASEGLQGGRHGVRQPKLVPQRETNCATVFISEGEV